MNQLPQIPDPGNRPARNRNPNRWADLAAFVAILLIGGAFIALAHEAAVLLVTTCAALGGLYEVWRRLRASQREQHPDDDQAGTKEE
jgi:hypothetical protein